MKKHMRLWFIGVLMVMGWVFAQNAAAQQKDFEIQNGVLVSYKGSGGDVVIPEGVFSIGECAFEDCSGLTSITIPKGVNNIGYRAFYGCSGLTSITIPNGVETIDREAFAGCSGLTTITIPVSVIFIGYRAFYDCSALEPEVRAHIESRFRKGPFQ